MESLIRLLVKAAIAYDCANLSQEEIEKIFQKHVHVVELCDKNTVALNEKKEQEKEAEGQVELLENLLRDISAVVYDPSNEVSVLPFINECETCKSDNCIAKRFTEKVPLRLNVDDWIKCDYCSLFVSLILSTKMS